jgi:hypothetical protein
MKSTTIKQTGKYIGATPYGYVYRHKSINYWLSWESVAFANGQADPLTEDGFREIVDSEGFQGTSDGLND